jgi:hypothetical protein
MVRVSTYSAGIGAAALMCYTISIKKYSNVFLIWKIFALVYALFCFSLGFLCGRYSDTYRKGTHVKWFVFKCRFLLKTQ